MMSLPNKILKKRKKHNPRRRNRKKKRKRTPNRSKFSKRKSQQSRKDHLIELEMEISMDFWMITMKISKCNKNFNKGEKEEDLS